MDDAEFRMAWLHDEPHQFDGFDDEYKAQVLEEEADKHRAFREYESRFASPDKAEGPDACRTCHGNGFISEDGAIFDCWKCAGSGYRASVCPAVADYHEAMIDQMLNRIT